MQVLSRGKKKIQDSQRRLEEQYYTYIVQKGSFSIVYKGIDLITNTEVAIKQIKLEDHNEKMQENFKSEVEICRSLDHPNILKLITTVETEKYPNLVFEYCQLGDLQEYIQRTPNKRLTEDESRPIINQIVSALMYLKENKIVHRDLKLANIFINSKFEIKVADFGFAKVKAELQNLQSICGTPITMAPEVLGRCQGGYDEKCDIWSLGVMIFQMVFGRNPFKVCQGGNPQDLLISILKQKHVEFPEDIPISDSLKVLIRDTIVVDPKDRISYEQLSEHEWLFNLGQSLFTEEVLSSIFEQPTKIELKVQATGIIIQSQAKINLLKQQLENLLSEIKVKEILDSLNTYISKLMNEVFEIQIKTADNILKIFIASDGSKITNEEYHMIDYYQDTYVFLLEQLSKHTDDNELKRMQIINILWDNIKTNAVMSNSITIIASKDNLSEITEFSQVDLKTLMSEERRMKLPFSYEDQIFASKDFSFEWNQQRKQQDDFIQDLALVQTIIESRQNRQNNKQAELQGLHD